MEYRWSVSLFDKHIEEYKKLHKQISIFNSSEKNECEYRIYQLENMKNYLLDKNELESPSPTFIFYKDKNRFLPTKIYKSYLDIPKYITETLLSATLEFRNLKPYEDENILPIIGLTDDEIVEMSYDFFKWLPNKKYLSLFEEYILKRKNLLHFSYEDYSLAGETIPFRYPIYTPYIHILKNNTINDFISLIHEMGHAIMLKNDDINSLISNHYYLMELEGFFFEYLARRYLKENFDNESIDLLEFIDFENIYNDFLDFFILDTGVSLVDHRKAIDIQYIQEKILKEELPFDIDETILINSLQADPVVSIKYLFSFLTSLDLELEADSDIEKAIYRLEKIRNNKDNVFQNLTDNHISFIGKDENYVPLQKKIERINTYLK